MTKLPVAVLPRVSLAEQFTVVAPTGKPNPDAGTHDTSRAPSTRSLAEDVNVTGVATAVASVVMLAGSVSTGAVASVIVTLKLPLPTLPCGSVAVHDTGVVPTPNPKPDA